MQIIDGHDLSAIREALDGVHERPKIIFLNTVKGRGISFMENRMDCHYLPLSEEQFRIALKEIESA